MNCSSDLKNFANSWPSASNVKSFSQPLEQFFLTVGQNNFGNKIPFLFRPMKHWEGYSNQFIPPNKLQDSGIASGHVEKKFV